jgi:hypothetical protein
LPSVTKGLFVTSLNLFIAFETKKGAYFTIYLSFIR